MIFLIYGIECSGHLPAEAGRWGVWDGGPELAAKHAAANSAALLAQLKEEVAAEKERRARHEASGPRSSTCHSCSSPSS